MDSRVYDASLLIGTGMASVGVGLMAGVGAALVTAGGLIIALTLASAWLAGKG